MSAKKLAVSGSALIGVALSLSGQQPQSSQRQPIVLRPVGHAVSLPLKSLPQVPAEKVVPREVPLLHRPGPAFQGLKPGELDPALQLQPIGPSAIFPGLHFEGLGNGLNGPVPPDTEGSVGSTQYVQWVNTSLQVFDKATGNPLLPAPVPGNQIWAGLGPSSLCSTQNRGDPIVRYDQLANRWVLTQFAFTSNTTPPFLQCIAVSTTADATGTYNLYAFDLSGFGFNDYGKLAVWPDAYYMSFHILAPQNITSPNDFGLVCAFDRAAMLQGTSAGGVCLVPPDVVWRTPTGALVQSWGLLPSDVDGSPPPAGSPNFILVPPFPGETPPVQGMSGIDLWKFHVDFVTPTNSTMTGPTVVVVQGFNEACNVLVGSTDDCVSQADTTQSLDTLGDRLMYRLAYRNFLPDHESLVVNHTVDTGVGIGIRWYEIRSLNGAFPPVFQQGTFAPTSDVRWMGSAALDHAGDLAVGYSVSSSTLHPAVRIAGRLPTDPLGTLGNEVSLVEGTGSQLPTTCTTATGSKPCGDRWGDYSAMTVDPVDDCTMWYTNEYYTGDLPAFGVNGVNWHTRIGNFQLANCPAGVAPASLPFSGQVVGTTSNPQTVTLTDSSTAPLAVSGVTVAGEFSVQGNPCAPSIPAGSACMISVTFTPPASGSRAGTLTITDNAFSSPQVVSLLGTGEDFALSGLPTSNTVSPGQTATYTVTIAPEGGMFPNAVSLICSGAPTLSVCSPSPMSVTPGGNSVTSTLTITTTAPVFGLLPPMGGVGARVLWVGLLVLVMLGIAIAKSRRLAFALPVALLAVLLVSQGSCGGGGAKGPRLISPGTPSGTFPITIMGTSGSLHHSTSVTLTVQ